MGAAQTRHWAHTLMRAAVILLVAACSAPPPSLRIAFAGPPSQSCRTDDRDGAPPCSDVEMLCPSVMSIRIIEPPEVDPDHPPYSQCAEMTPNAHKNMCVVANVQLLSTPLPVRDLEVQIAVYPATEIPVDPADPSQLMCPKTVQYSASTGFPLEHAPTPSLGGRAFYHPGDQTVTVTLGCTHLEAINASCAGSKSVDVAASVENFKDRFPVTDATVVNRLEVAVGEPHQLNSAFELNPTETTPLMLQIDGNRPTWDGKLPALPARYACLRVRDSAPQSTATATCQQVSPDQPLDLVGELLAKEQLDPLVKALGLAEFPPQGLTVGIVVDQVGDPVPGAVIAAKQHAVAYQTDSGFSGTATSDLGIFVSTDAPFGTEFSTDAMIHGTVQSLSGIGGLIDGMVTVVVLRPAGPQ